MEGRSGGKVNYVFRECGVVFSGTLQAHPCDAHPRHPCLKKPRKDHPTLPEHSYVIFLSGGVKSKSKNLTPKRIFKLKETDCSTLELALALSTSIEKVMHLVLGRLVHLAGVSVAWMPQPRLHGRIYAVPSQMNQSTQHGFSAPLFRPTLTFHDLSAPLSERPNYQSGSL